MTSENVVRSRIAFPSRYGRRAAISDEKEKAYEMGMLRLKLCDRPERLANIDAEYEAMMRRRKKGKP